MAGDVIEFVLDGLERALELERELGVRTVEVTACELRVPKAERRSPEPPPRTPPPRTPPSQAPKTDPRVPKAALPASDLVFVHDRPLTPDGVEMMAKIVVAMGRTAENTPIVVAPPLPKSKIVVVLGGLAMKRFFPSLHGEPGQWYRLHDGTDVLITYSPAYILRFGTVTPAVEKLKREMWRSLKAVVQRLQSA